MNTDRHGFRQKETEETKEEKFLGPSFAVSARLMVLFIALAGIKLALLLQLGKRLFEVHWRLTPHVPVWGDYVLFGVFVVVGFVSVMRLHRHCLLVGLRAIRA